MCLQCGRPGFDPWVGKTPWRRIWQPTWVFLPGESPWTEEPGWLQSMGSQRVGHDWSDLATAAAAAIMGLGVIRQLCVIWNFSHNKRVAFVIKAINICYAVLCHSAVSVSLWPRGLKPARLLCPWGFSRQEYWTGLPCPPPGDLPNPRIEPRSPTLQADSLPAELPGNL